ncbi:hypothetical protein LLB_2131 [Legionella longbeachae D-4968]|nr:hypothetical protein LLB_2131 [Legionella longbeachae D-4968]
MRFLRREYSKLEHLCVKLDQWWRKFEKQINDPGVSLVLSF